MISKIEYSLGFVKETAVNLPVFYQIMTVTTIFIAHIETHCITPLLNIGCLGHGILLVMYCVVVSRCENTGE
jgi:hypothetical protein